VFSPIQAGKLQEVSCTFATIPIGAGISCKKATYRKFLLAMPRASCPESNPTVHSRTAPPAASQATEVPSHSFLIRATADSVEVIALDMILEFLINVFTTKNDHQRFYLGFHKRVVSKFLTVNDVERRAAFDADRVFAHLHKPGRNLLAYSDSHKVGHAQHPLVLFSKGPRQNHALDTKTEGAVLSDS
jgi:hypothetical protein